MRGNWRRDGHSRLLRRSLAQRLGLRRSEPLVRTHVEAVTALTEAALTGDQATITVLLAMIDHELGEAGHYCTCCLLAERILLAEGIATPLTRLRRRRPVTAHVLGPGGELAEAVPVRRAGNGAELLTATVVEFVTAHGNGETGRTLQLWAQVCDHPDRRYRTAFLAEFLAVAADVVRTREVTPAGVSN